MHTQTSFLGFPAELRMEVYKHYVSAPDGYVYNWKTGALLRADGQPIDLALSRTCRLIACEMRGLALRSKSIAFSTFYSDESRLRAGQFHWLVSSLRWAETKFIHAARHLLTPDIYQDVAGKYPLFIPMMDHVLNRDNPRPGSSRYIYREAMGYCVRLMASRGQSIRGGRELGEFAIPRQKRVQNGNKWSGYKPWDVPDEDYTRDTEDLWKMRVNDNDPFVVDPVKSLQHSRQKYRVSAAAGAISFLRSIPPATRSHISRILLYEDRESVGMPECHAQGLIPFCAENPRLHVERHVNLWRNVFQQKQTQLIKRFGDHYWESTEHIQAFQIAEPVISWVAEALALGPAGMPKGAFSLVLDGDPSPDACTEIFQAVVQRYLAWNIAVSESLSRGHISELGFRRRLAMNRDDVQEAEQCLEALMDDGPLVRCNFCPGRPWDVEAVIEKHSRWTLEEWDYNWQNYKPRVYDTPPELPRWIDLLLEDVLPREEEEQLVGEEELVRVESLVDAESLIDEDSLEDREEFAQTVDLSEFVTT